MTSSDGRVTEGFAAVPIHPDGMHSPVRTCVIVRREPGNAPGPFVVLREALDARVLLGGLADAQGRIHEWLEIWIQRVNGLAAGTEAQLGVLSNALLDERWAGHFDGLCQANAGAVLATGWESSHPPPLFISLKDLVPLVPAHRESGEPWSLCRDDALLQRNGLPPYSSSLHRYLYVPKLENESPFAPVTEGAPAPSARGVALADLLAASPGLAPLNPEGGLLFVRTYDPVSYDSFVELLGGAAWDEITGGRNPLPLQAMGAEGPPFQSGFLVDRKGVAARLAEAFHLKLKLLADTVEQVRAFIEKTDRPLLNLSAESFRVRLSAPGQALPAYWTGRASLADAGIGVKVHLPSTDQVCYMTAGPAASSVYRPPMAAPVRSRGSVRLRKVTPDPRGGGVVEGTLETQERLQPGVNDLLHLRAPIGGTAMDLYAQATKDVSLAATEWRFRTVRQSWTKAQGDALRAAEGTVFTDVVFDLLPQTGSPCDLFALAVLAVRTLLVNRQNSLPVALDQVMSLAKQAGEEADDSAGLAGRIKRVFDREKRWHEALGPQRLLRDEMKAADARESIPAELWFVALAMIIRALPGLGRDSRCRDLGDAPAGSQQAVLDRLTEDLRGLLLRTRSLIVCDAGQNREILQVLRGFIVE